MAFTHTLPTDSMLRRHALTERNRSLGVPPTDSVLKRHYAQLQAVQRSSPADAPVLAKVAGASPRMAQAPARVTPAAVHTPATPAAAGGLMSWLRRLLGAT